ncbi:PREDICTED: double-stranded RNA-specific adenosine deaminase-like [Nanorana parkeri]|uniref:double-stranded RNA-specific adenosine deaminase-like n=1 Tax=Nanorana parkeri TaxID=125878 RepID=UPI00085456FE|nr:PREDICTED: double-stranded RNA-specific adenosine deaminase-like [Nanorana parkeri]
MDDYLQRVHGFPPLPLVVALSRSFPIRSAGGLSAALPLVAPAHSFTLLRADPRLLRHWRQNRALCSGGSAPEAETRLAEAVRGVSRRWLELPAAATTGSEQHQALLLAQRDFLQGNQSGNPVTFPAWNAYRNPPGQYATDWNPPRPPLISHPPPLPPARPPRDQRSHHLAQQFENLSVSGDHFVECLIEKFRELGGGRSHTARDLARQLRVEKKHVNHHLYKLENLQVVCKEGDKPPRWRLVTRNQRPEQRPPPAYLQATHRAQQPSTGGAAAAGPLARISPGRTAADGLLARISPGSPIEGGAVNVAFRVRLVS